MDTRIVWFRRDLRLTDHPALAAALDALGSGGALVALFVVDPTLVRSATMSRARLVYLRDALADLDDALRKRGSALVVRTGDPRDVVVSVAAQVSASAVHHGEDVTPYAQRRDHEVARRLGARGVDVRVHNTVLVHAAGRVRTAGGEMFRVYSPFRRAWDALDVAAPLPAPRRIPPAPDVRSEPLPSLSSLVGSSAVPAERAPAAPLPAVASSVGRPEKHLPGGETAAGDRLETFLAAASRSYRHGRDQLAESGTSRLSADLHYGCVSPRAVLARLDPGDAGHEAFRGEIAWRDFYAHVMHRWPEVRSTEFNPQMRGMPWRGASALYDAWREGHTGYPVVDAGMRQLSAESWMHNRARMLVASFLCKDLLTDWRLGQAHFLRHLVDADVASNNGGWQWAAGTGTDAQPFFRVFNPVVQGEKFDPSGAYVRRYVPELRRVPDLWIHKPWAMPPATARDAGVRLGVDYPTPIVDHAQARREALAVLERHRGR